MSVHPYQAAGERVNAEQLRAYFMAASPCVARLVPAPTDPVVPRGLVDVRDAASGLYLLPAPAWSAPDLRFLVRPEVAERLAAAVDAMPANLRLGFWEGLRPLSVQQALWDSGLGYLRAAHPHLPHEDLEGLLEQYVAHPAGSAPPHSTGSAVDVAPVDAFGRVLNPDDAWGKLAVELMGKALSEAGLAHYQPEWWHWSYGDEEWARAYDCAPLPFATAPSVDDANGPGDGI